MIVQIIGWVCIALGVWNIITAFYLNARYSELCVGLFFIAAAICFK